MRFRFSDEQEMLRRTVRAFADRELTPEYLRELDAKARAPQRAAHGLPWVNICCAFIPRCAPFEWAARSAAVIVSMPDL